MDVTRAIAHDLSGLVGGLSSLKGEGTHWLEAPEYEALRLRLGIAHASAEPALVEVRRRGRLDEGR